MDELVEQLGIISNDAHNRSDEEWEEKYGDILFTEAFRQAIDKHLLKRLKDIIHLHEKVYVGYEPTEAKRRLIYDLKSAIK